MNRRPSTRYVRAAAAFFLIASSVFASTQTKLPSTILSSDRTEYLWVDSQSAVLPSGDVNTKLFSDHAAAMVSGYLSTPAKDGCIEIGAVMRDYAGTSPIGTLKELRDSASIVVAGVVKSRASGFYTGIPGQLILIETTSVVRDERKGEQIAQFFLFIPVGDFSVGERTICKSDYRYATAPAIGDRVLILSRDPIGENSDVLHLTDPAQLVVLKGGKPQYARTLQESAGARLPGDERTLLRALGKPRSKAVE